MEASNQEDSNVASSIKNATSAISKVISNTTSSKNKIAPVNLPVTNNKEVGGQKPN